MSMKAMIPAASNEAIEIITKMLRVNPDKRPSAKLLLEEAYFKNIPIKAHTITLKIQPTSTGHNVNIPQVKSMVESNEYQK